MHFRHHNTPENTEVFVQNMVENSPIQAGASQAKLVSQGTGQLHRKLSEKIHDSLKAHSESFLAPSPHWQKECDEAARRHKEKHDRHLHSEASMTNILASSSAAAGFGVIHASTFTAAGDGQHDFNAPGHNSPGYHQDQYDSQASSSNFGAPAVSFGRQESGIAAANGNQYESKLPASPTTARELADESLGFISGPSSNDGNYTPHSNQVNSSVPTKQARNINSPAPYPNPSTLPAQLQIRPKPSTPPYPSQQSSNASYPSCTAEVTIKSTSQIIDIIRQLQIEGFFNPSNVLLLPSQLEMRLKKQDVVGPTGGRGPVVELPGCMPDERGFGAEGDGGGDKNREEGESRAHSDAEDGEMADEGESEKNQGGHDDESHGEGEDGEGEDGEGDEGKGDGGEGKDGEDGYDNESHHEAGEDEHGEGEDSEHEGHNEDEEAGETGDDEDGENENGAESHGEESEGEQSEHEDGDAEEHEDESYEESEEGHEAENGEGEDEDGEGESDDEGYVEGSDEVKK
ncbi:hypothetical protein N431DRAFT_544700 [Stipitochalara longipes BDJ]|nr:hypothetical protein N431DRAFT_544700 [Stipitochalara longipes BDJ]